MEIFSLMLDHSMRPPLTETLQLLLLLLLLLLVLLLGWPKNQTGFMGFVTQH